MWTIWEYLGIGTNALVSGDDGGVGGCRGQQARGFRHEHHGRGIVRIEDENEVMPRKTGGHCAWEGKGTMVAENGSRQAELEVEIRKEENGILRSVKRNCMAVSG